MAKKVVKSKDTFTVKDFKMWLLGMTEFQEPEWTPNAKQWKAILDKVDLLEDNVQYVQDTTSVQQYAGQTNPAPVQNNRPAPFTPLFNDLPGHNTGGYGEQAPPQRFHDEPVFRHQPAQTSGIGGGGGGSSITSDPGIVSTNINESFV